jgi:hypothetical protein
MSSRQSLAQLCAGFITSASVTALCAAVPALAPCAALAQTAGAPETDVSEVVVTGSRAIVNGNSAPGGCADDRCRRLEPVARAPEFSPPCKRGLWRDRRGW